MINASSLSTATRPSVMTQIYELLTPYFSHDEALSMSRHAATLYKSTPQKLFQFEGVTIEVMACIAKLRYAPRGFESVRKTLERVEMQECIQLEQRARNIREKRERDERRGW